MYETMRCNVRVDQDVGRPMTRKGHSRRLFWSLRYVLFCAFTLSQFSRHLRCPKSSTWQRKITVPQHSRQGALHVSRWPRVQNGRKTSYIYLIWEVEKRFEKCRFLFLTDKLKSLCCLLDGWVAVRWIISQSSIGSASLSRKTLSGSSLFYTSISFVFTTTI